MKSNGEPSVGELMPEVVAQFGQPAPGSFITVTRSEPPPAATNAPAAGGGMA